MDYVVFLSGKYEFPRYVQCTIQVVIGQDRQRHPVVGVFSPPVVGVGEQEDEIFSRELRVSRVVCNFHMFSQ